MIGEAAAYNDDQSAVPVPDTVTALIRFGDDDVVQTGIADLLGENYWGLVGILSR